MNAVPDVLPRLDFAWAGSTRVPPGSSYGPYTTAYWEFIWGMDGSARVLSGDDSFVFGARSLQLTPPGVRNFYEWHPTVSSSYGYAIFTMADSPEWPRFRAARSDDLVPELLDHVLWLDSTHPAGWREAAALVMAYAVHAFVTGDSLTRLGRDRELPEAITRSLAVVRERWDAHGLSAVPLEDLATAAGVSREHLSRVYAKYTGMGPVSAMRTLRLSRAAELLSHTNLGIAEIARIVGFPNEFHFSRAFRALSGQSPSSFRRDPDSRLELPVALQRLGTQLLLR